MIMKLCEIEGCENYTMNERVTMCATHAQEQRKLDKQLAKPPKEVKRIKKMSDKRRVDLVTYSKEKAKFIKGKICPVYPLEPVTDIHHQMGRVGFADDWARSKEITLLMDQRYWLAVSRKGHDCIETHPSLARARGWSLPRTEIIQDKEPTI